MAGLRARSTGNGWFGSTKPLADCGDVGEDGPLQRSAR
jgi:hypothetical protein